LIRPAIPSAKSRRRIGKSVAGWRRDAACVGGCSINQSGHNPEVKRRGGGLIVKWCSVTVAQSGLNIKPLPPRTRPQVDMQLCRTESNRRTKFFMTREAFAAVTGFANVERPTQTDRHRTGRYVVARAEFGHRVDLVDGVKVPSVIRATSPVR
jgi:hypothetical protein